MIRNVLKKTCRCAVIGMAAACAALSGCASGSSSDFASVVEVADESDGNLPKATEVGSNTAGAYFAVRYPTRSERYTWTMNYLSSVGSQSAEISIAGNGMLLSIPGHLKTPYTDIMWLTFAIPNPPAADTLPELQKLSHVSHRSSSGLQVRIAPQQNFLSSVAPVQGQGFSFTYGNPITVKDATLSFTRCRLIYKDQSKLVGVSVAGRFTLQGTAADTIRIAVDNGRFDLLFKSHSDGIFSSQ